MAEGRLLSSEPIRNIAWWDIFPWLILIRATRLAFRGKVLLLATLGILATTAGWRIVGGVFSSSDDPHLRGGKAVEVRSISNQPLAQVDQPRGWIESLGSWPWHPAYSEVSDEVLPQGAESAVTGAPVLGNTLRLGPLLDVWQYISAPFRSIFSEPLSLSALAYLLLCCLWAALIWGIFAAAITRVAGLQLARNQPLGLFASLGFARGKLSSTFVAPLVPLIGVLILSVPLILLSLLLRLDIGLVLGGIFWFVLLIWALMAVLLLLGLLLGWPLMDPAISVESTDSFDALSRSYAYLYQRPLYYLWCILFASVLGYLAALAVQVVGVGVLHLADLTAAWGAGGERLRYINALAAGSDEGSFLARNGAAMIAFWRNLVLTVMLAFKFGFFFCTATAIYLVLRRNVDHTEMDEIYVDEEEDLRGLPTLETDAAGVPGVPAEGASASSAEPHPAAADAAATDRGQSGPGSGASPGDHSSRQGEGS